MSEDEHDNETDIAKDGSVWPATLVSAMEPMTISESCPQKSFLTDLAFTLSTRSAVFTESVPAFMRKPLADLVRSMNCYYSNLIEGHYTHPAEIERALKNDYLQDPQKRDLQLEARAHIEVQQWIDSGAISGRVFAAETIREMHRRFCDKLPRELLQIKDLNGNPSSVVNGGEYREQHVKVGQHIAIAPELIPNFMTRFENVYQQLGRSEKVLSAAASHHRLLWIHPFIDGNGRVARLMSHAMFLEELNSAGLWSIARGLSRRVAEYKSHLAACDSQRRNDLDGRGNLSQESLAEFTKFYLEICLDQITFMDQLVAPKDLRSRILRWSAEEIEKSHLPANSVKVLEVLLYRGEITRKEVAEIISASTRHAQRTISALESVGVVYSESTRAPLRLAFPASLAPRWMPGLFPDQPY